MVLHSGVTLLLDTVTVVLNSGFSSFTGKSYKCPAWIFRLVFNKNPSWNEANSLKTILGLSVQGLSVQGGNRYGSTLVLSNKNHVEDYNYIHIQHGFCSTKQG